LEIAGGVFIQKAAKDLLRWVHTSANYEKWFISQKGFATPPTPQ
jgi:multiple sugar transport system substrate-binding protein